MLALLNIVLPVFILIGAGYLAVRSKLFSDENAGVLMRFATHFAVPCLLFSAISKLDLSAAFSPTLIASFYTGATASFILTTLVARHLFGHQITTAVVIGFTAFFGNTLLLGLAIVERAYGPAVMQPTFAIISVHAPFCYLVGITTMEFLRAKGNGIGQTLKTTLKTIFSNALMIGIALGFFVNFTQLPLPEPLVAAVEMLARAALPIALFGLGAAMVQYKLTGNLRDTALICVSKLLIHPSIAWVLATQVFMLSSDMTRAAVTIAAMAPGINAYVFATMYNRAQDTVAATVLISTGLSILTASLWLSILGT